MNTLRKYAHKLYPHPADDETRPLSVEVPYLYARMVGLDVHGTGWGAAAWRDNEWAREATVSRTLALVEARQKAWDWAETRAADESGEVAGDRAAHYGIPFEQIKPYPCGPEPDYHNHYGPATRDGWRTSERVVGKESECAECCEPETDAP